MAPPAEQLRTRLDEVRSLARPARLAALTAALDQGGEHELLAIAIELIELAIVPDVPTGRRSFPWHGQSRIWADKALGHVLARWERLPDEARTAALVVGSTRLAGSARRVLDSQSREHSRASPDRPIDSVRRSIALLAQHAGDAGLLQVCAPLLGDDDEGVASLAEGALLALAMGPSDDPGLVRPEFQPPEPILAHVDRFDEGADRVTIEQVSRAVVAFPQHRRRGVLLAALILLARPRPGRRSDAPLDRLRTLVSDETHPAGAVIKSVLRLSRAPLTRTLAWRLLGDEALSGAARARLERSHTLEDHQGVLELSHLAVVPRRQRHLAAVRVALRTVRSGDTSEHATRTLAPGGVLPTGPEYDALSASARRGLVRFVRAMDLGPAARTAALEATLDDDRAIVRHAAARTAPPALQLDLTLDADPRVARTALCAWSLAGTGRWLAMALGSGGAGRARTIERLTRSPHRSVRAYAAEEIGRLGPWLPDLPASRLIARRLLERAPEAFIEAVRPRLGSQDSTECEQAIRLCLVLGLQEHFENELIEATRTEQSEPAAVRAAASAATALGRIPSLAAHRALMACLSHADGRVRANAVSSIAHHPRPDRLGQSSPDTPAPADPLADRSTDVMLIELKDSSHHRVRANALRALLARAGGAQESGMYEPSAIEGLLAMLSDDRAAHRLAGLWLAEHSLQAALWQKIEPHGSAVALRVSDLIGTNQSEAIHRRAVRCARRLSARTRSGWCRSIASPGNVTSSREDSP